MQGHLSDYRKKRHFDKTPEPKGTKKKGKVASAAGIIPLRAGKPTWGWHLRQHPRALDLEFKKGLKRPEKINAIELYLRGEMAPQERKPWEACFERVPEALTEEDKRDWIAQMEDITLSSDAFIPFRDNIDRAVRTGVKYVVQAGGSLRDSEVTAAADEYGMAMAFSGVRLFHH